LFSILKGAQFICEDNNVPFRHHFCLVPETCRYGSNPIPWERAYNAGYDNDLTSGYIMGIGGSDAIDELTDQAFENAN
jgi:hypothetical protein